ncbi:MAG TPA: sigma-70 family RNA polymerase sigma factor [Ilumatobacteraceae bacterium]
MLAEPPLRTKEFESFYRRAWHDAARWATALTGDAATGEEIAQDAFIAVARRYADLDNPDGYLRVTVVNLARSAMRSSMRRAWREQRTVGDDVVVVSHDDGEIVAALGRLSYEQRAVLVLRYWADWDEEAIADALGCRPSTVRSHARRALVLLRQEVQR